MKKLFFNGSIIIAVLNVTSLHASLFDKIAQGLNNAVVIKPSTESENSEANNQNSLAKPSANVADSATKIQEGENLEANNQNSLAKPTAKFADSATKIQPSSPDDLKPFYKVSSDGPKMPIPYGKPITSGITRLRLDNNSWYFKKYNNSWIFKEASFVQVEPGYEIDKSETVIIFDPAYVDPSSEIDKMFLQLKSTQEKWWQMNTQNRNPNEILFGDFTGYIDAKMMLDSVKTDSVNLKVKIYKSIESGDGFRAVIDKLSKDSTVTLTKTNSPEIIEFTTTYLGDPCIGSVSLSTKGHVSTVVLVSLEQVALQKYFNKKIQTELEKSDADRALDALQDQTQSTQDKINASENDIDAVNRASKLEIVTKKWYDTINEKYPSGYSSDNRVQYVIEKNNAMVSIIDVYELNSDRLLNYKNNFQKRCDGIEADFKKFSSSKNDL